MVNTADKTHLEGGDLLESDYSNDKPSECWI